MRYLSAYVFRTAISHKRIVSISEGSVTFAYTDTKSGVEKGISLKPFEFNRRSLLPRLRRLGPHALLLTTSRPVSFGVHIAQGEARMIRLPAPITNSDSAPSDGAIEVGPISIFGITPPYGRLAGPSPRIAL